MMRLPGSLACLAHQSMPNPPTNGPTRKNATTCVKSERFARGETCDVDCLQDPRPQKMGTNVRGVLEGVRRVARPPELPMGKGAELRAINPVPSSVCASIN